MAKDKIKGGLSDGMTPEDVAKKHKMSVKDIKAQIKMGIKVEMEHVNDAALAEEIALDHLFEIPDYYTRLDKMENEAKKEMKEKGMKTEGKENITEFARRMRELAGFAEGSQNKSLKTIQEGVSSFEDGATFMAKDMMASNDTKKVPGDLDINGNPIPVNESEEKDDFETHKFEQKTIEEGADDEELYTLNENTIIVLDFLKEDEE